MNKLFMVLYFQVADSDGNICNELGLNISEHNFSLSATISLLLLLKTGNGWHIVLRASLSKKNKENNNSSNL